MAQVTLPMDEYPGASGNVGNEEGSKRWPWGPEQKTEGEWRAEGRHPGCLFCFRAVWKSTIIPDSG